MNTYKLLTTNDLSLALISAAPIRSEVDDISLFIINFEDLSDPQTLELPLTEEHEPLKLSKCKFPMNFR